MLISRGDVGIEASILGADEEDEAEAVAIGEACLARFDADFERGVVIDPIALTFIEVFFEISEHRNEGRWENGIWG